MIITLYGLQLSCPTASRNAGGALPYLTARIQRFGVYATDEIALTPEPFDAHLELDLATATDASATSTAT